MSTARPVDTEAGAAQSFGPTILLVEDERSIGTLVRGYLERAGYRLIWVRTGDVVIVPVSPGARITLGGRAVSLAALRKGMRAQTVRNGSAPADTVQAFRR